jgi:hypothetical protein
MPTGEFKKLLDREFSKATVRPIAELSTPLLQELVNSGLMIFRRCEKEASRAGKENEDIAAMALYRHVIEMVDTVEVLVANSCGTGAIPVLRSVFEGALSLLYLLSDDKKYVDRALSWLVADIHIRIKARQILEPGTQRGEEYAQLYAKEFAKVIPRVPQAEIAAEIQQLEQLLQAPQFSSITAEYQQTKKQDKRDPDWFSLYGGPKNRAELASTLGKGAIYRLLYGDWSTLAHGNDLRRYVSDGSGMPVFDGVRRPNELQFISQLSALLLIEASRTMIQKFRKGENLEPWYKREVKPLLDKLLALKVTITPLHEE